MAAGEFEEFLLLAEECFDTGTAPVCSSAGGASDLYLGSDPVVSGRKKLSSPCLQYLPGLSLKKYSVLPFYELFSPPDHCGNFLSPNPFFRDCEHCDSLH